MTDVIGVYSQTTGQLITIGPPIDVARCYSGHGSGLNNPVFEDKASLGPIPRGLYLIGLPHDHPRLGPCVMTLTPSGHSARGRSGFYLHGDNKAGNRTASTGCIIADRDTRNLYAAASRARSVSLLVIE